MLMEVLNSKFLVEDIYEVFILLYKFLYKLTIENFLNKFR